MARRIRADKILDAEQHRDLADTAAWCRFAGEAAALSWTECCDWPTYDFNNGMTLGLPKGLKRLFAREADDVAAQKARRFTIVDMNAHAGTAKLISPEGVTYDCLEGHSQQVLIREPMVPGSKRIVLDVASPIMARLTPPVT